MNGLRKMSLLLIIALSGSATALSATPADDPLQARVSDKATRFVQAVRSCGIEPTFEPHAEIGENPGVIVYYPRTRVVRIARWDTLPPPIQGFLDGWAKHQGSGLSGQALFERLFNDFLVGHELGHWLEHQAGRMAANDYYQGELDANRIAIAFAALDQGGEAAGAYVDDFTYLATLPNPVPAGTEPRAWFNDNYARISTSDPLAYNWFQGRLMQDAWKQHRDGDFCDLAGRQVGP